MSDFNGKIVVVTGAAGNLGRAVVKAFLDRGATVFGFDHKAGRMMGIDTTDYHDGKFFPLDYVDVTDSSAVDQAAERVHQLSGPADILVNCLGGFSSGETVYEMSQQTWDRMMAINVGSFLNLTRGFMPDLLGKGTGRVVAVAAGAALKGGARMGAYSAAKAGLLRLVESLAAEVSSTDIRVNCVMPGTIDSPQNRADMPNADRSLWVPPKAVAEAIIFLASSGTDYVNGAVLPVRG